MMKKGMLGKLLACMVITLVVLSGCNSKNEYGLSKKDPVTITVWNYYNGAQQQMFDAAVSEFNETVGAQKGIMVEAYSQGSVDDLKNKVLDSVNHVVGADNMPDVFSAYADTAYEVDHLGMVADIGKYLTEEEVSEYVDEYIEEGRFDDSGSIKDFPIAKSTEIFMLNKTDWDKFAAATGAGEESFKTWEGIAKVAEQYYKWTDSLTETPDDGKAFFGRDAMANYIIIGSMQLGKELFHVENGTVTYQVDREVMKRIWDCYYVPYVNGYYTAIGRFRSDDAKTGDLIALVGSTSGSLYFPTAVTMADGSSYDIEAKVYPLPNFEGTESYAVQQGAGMVVTKSDEKHEYAATVFLKWFTDVQKNVSFSIGSGYLPVKKEANNWQVLEKEINNSEVLKTPALKDVLKVGVEMVDSYHLYTNKAFENGTVARDIVETSMAEKAAQDAQFVKEKIAQGMSREEAVAEFVTDENFDAWLETFTQQLQAARK